MNIKLYPVIELLDLHYAYKYDWLSKLVEVSDGVMLRPEKKLGDAFKNNKAIRQYLSDRYNISLDLLNMLKIMFDHGIFLSTRDFKQIFGVRKDPKTLIKVYDTLGVDYGLAYDIPARLHVEFAIRSATSELFDYHISDKLSVAIHYSMKPYLRRLIKELVAHIEENNYSKLDIQTVRAKISRLTKSEQKIKKYPKLYKAIHDLSKAAVKETVRRVKRQLQFKNKTGSRFILLPVVQGLYEEHAKKCLIEVIDLLIRYDEILMDDSIGTNNIYVAIGTGGRVLSEYEAKVINKIMRIGYKYARTKGFNIRYHLLGWSSPRVARKLELEFVYSSDSLSARRRAGEGKIYIMKDNNNYEVELKAVSEIKYDNWNCNCPACNDPKLRYAVLDPAGTRKNDVRMVHNLWIIKQFLRKVKVRL